MIWTLENIQRRYLNIMQIVVASKSEHNRFAAITERLDLQMTLNSLSSSRIPAGQFKLPVPCLHSAHRPVCHPPGSLHASPQLWPTLTIHENPETLSETRRRASKSANLLSVSVSIKSHYRMQGDVFAYSNPDGRGRSPNSAGPPGGNGSSSSKRNKPCQQCQKLKVKCERNPTGGPCTRCAAQKKECTYYELPSKKRKKDPDE